MMGHWPYSFWLRYAYYSTSHRPAQWGRKRVCGGKSRICDNRPGLSSLKSQQRIDGYPQRIRDDQQLIIRHDSLALFNPADTVLVQLNPPHLKPGCQLRLCHLFLLANLAFPGFLLGILMGLLSAVIILAFFKFLGWLSAFGFTCRSITLAAHEKILNADFTAAPAAPVAPAAPAATKPAEPVKHEKPEIIEPPRKTEFEYEQKSPKRYVAWNCPHCGTSNSGYQNFCINCNSTKE